MSEPQEQTKPPPSLELSIGDGGRGEAVTVIASIAGDELHRDQVNLNRADHRSRFARAIAKQLPRFKPAEIDSQLLKLQADAEAAAAREASDDRPKGDEMDACELTRPELIIRRGYVAVAVPRLLKTRSEPEGAWTLYAKSGSKRTATELEPSIIAGGTALYVHPFPYEPTAADVSELCVWSRASREAWTAGNVRPTTADAFIAVMERIERYIELPSDDEHGSIGHQVTLALWVMLSYCYPVFPAVPYLYLAGPAGSGKTRTMDLMGRMVFRPMFSSNTTAANIFRSLHSRGGVLLLDEAEQLKDDRSPETGDINSILLSGYRRGGRATRMEAAGDTFRPVSFDVYSPKLLACIRGLPPALSSRCITLRLSRAAAGSQAAARSLDDSPSEEQSVRDILHAWTLEHSAELLDTPPPATTLANRDAERWEPLFRIAAMTGDEGLIGTLIDHAARQVEAETDDATPEADPSLLAALYVLTRTQPKVAPGDVLEEARNIDPDAFTTDWNPRRVSAVLRRYGFRTVRNNGRRIYRLDAAAVRNTATRYGYPIEVSASDTEGTDEAF